MTMSQVAKVQGRVLREQDPWGRRDAILRGRLPRVQVLSAATAEAQ